MADLHSAHSFIPIPTLCFFQDTRTSTIFDYWPKFTIKSRTRGKKSQRDLDMQNRTTLLLLHSSRAIVERVFLSHSLIGIVFRNK